MARAIWSGAINFGLVTIPVKLMTAVREKGVHFNLLHEKDMGRVHNERVCDSCKKKLSWDDVVRGFPVEKDNYVVITDDDLKKAYPEATQSVDIVSFASETEIDPMLYDTPYYLEPDKRGRRAYALLREALRESGQVGIARVVIRTKEHLSVVRPQGDALVLELLHWADEVVPADNLELPTGKADAVRAPEMKAARMLIDSMTEKFDASEFKDHTREQILRLVEARAEGKTIAAPKAGAPKATNVVDLAEMLKKSLHHARPKDEEPAAKAGPGARRAPLSKAKKRSAPPSRRPRAPATSRRRSA